MQHFNVNLTWSLSQGSDRLLA